jgi:hypothetical protein
VAGSATYRWNDLNRDHFAQANEVLLDQFITAGGGFNPAAPTAVTSANAIDPDLRAPKTTSIVAGVDRELRPNLAVTVNYSYTKTTDLLGNFTAAVTPRVGVTLADYSAGTTLTGTLPDGSTYSVPTSIPNQAAVTAGGNGFLLTNWKGNSTDYHGIELGMTKRLSDRWMGRVGFGYNNAREHYSPEGTYNTNGNPTPTLTEPLRSGGQFAPQSGGSGAGTIYINAKWQFNANAMYQAPYGIEVSANVFGRQGYPWPIFQQVSLGADTGTQVLVSPDIDAFRFDNLWNTDIRGAKEFRMNTLRLRLIGDLFNVFNANTELVRSNNAAATSNRFALAQNLSPRIFRVGLIVGF